MSSFSFFFHLNHDNTKLATYQADNEDAAWDQFRAEHGDNACALAVIQHEGPLKVVYQD